MSETLKREPSTLATRLRAETRALHQEVEATPFISRLLRGELGRAAYSALLRNLHEIYAALEAGLLANAGHPQIARLFTPKLLRTAGLERDLEALQGPGWPALPIAPAARRYGEHLKTLSALRPELLAAHLYVRYLGDLSGGQMLEAIVAKSLGPGLTAFYDFGGREEAKHLARELRAGFGALDGEGELASAIVAEAREAFEAHRTLFSWLEQ